MDFSLTPETIRILIFAAIAYIAYMVLARSRHAPEQEAGASQLHTPAPLLPGHDQHQVSQPAQHPPVPGHTPFDGTPAFNTGVLPYPQMSNEPANPFGSQITPDELLPTDKTGFAASNPQVPGHLTGQNFLDAGYHGGVNTSGGSKRNGNRQLRSDPVIPRIDVGPWNQSTSEPPSNRREFDIH